MKPIRPVSAAFYSLIALLWLSVAAGAGTALPDDATAADWRSLLGDYEQRMVAITEEVVDDITQPADTAADKRWQRLEYFEQKLEQLDTPTRATVMSQFIQAIQDHYGDPAALVDTGGSKAGQSGFRYGFGDYDLEAPEQNIALIRKQLERLVPAVAIEDHGDYIEVAELRLIVFKRRPISTLADLDRMSPADLDRAAGDKEVYLHLRLPESLPAKASALEKDAYQKLVKALAIQGHIKKGSDGLSADPQQLIDNPELLQSLSKSALKAMNAVGLWGPYADAKDRARLKAILDAEGFHGGLNGFDIQVESLKSFAYLNPALVGLTLENINRFQTLVRRVLALVDHKSKQMADEALTALDAWQDANPGGRRAEALLIAARLYKKQREVNQQTLEGVPPPESLEGLC